LLHQTLQILVTKKWLPRLWVLLLPAIFSFCFAFFGCPFSFFGSSRHCKPNSFTVESTVIQWR
jgi:hypothetical protein